ncbi:MAG: leucyl aminopeptidase [Bdellovibrionales bacterium]|nr:leucyl aminopeptidase [Bdellovibrionales bacterium]
MRISIQDKAGKKQPKTTVLFISTQDVEGKSRTIPPFQNILKPLWKEAGFKGEKRDLLFLPSTKSGKHFILIGLGNEEELNYEGVRLAGARAFKSLKQYKQTEGGVQLETLLRKQTSSSEKTSQAFTEGFILSSYECKDFKKPDAKAAAKNISPENIIFLLEDKTHKEGAEKGLKTGKILGESTNTIKTLANYPGNRMTRSILAQQVKTLTKNTKTKTTVWDKARIKKEKMGGLLGVSLGSSEEPRFIIMEYKGAGPSKKPICLVGKGLTFDSGGISLKPSFAMEDMKFDMCGSTAVIGAMLAIEKLNLKVNVLGLIPSSENMPGASANKPGDILKARNGKTMEILNTDAEGRLILADALSYACEQKPQAIFDVATLTGAIVVALGNVFTGIFTKNEDLLKKIREASHISGEKIWHLPLTQEHREDMKSNLADVANISPGRGAGSSTAAAFLEHFVDKAIPWAHFDIAGTAYNTANRLEYCQPKFASGVMVRTFVELARSFEK